MHMGVVLIGPGRWLSSMEGALASKILAAAPSMRTLNFLLYALTETSAVNDALQPLGHPREQRSNQDDATCDDRSSA